MNLLEHEAKRILKGFDLPVPRGQVVEDEDQLPDVNLPCVLKSQVPTGGRGKAGGVKVVKDRAELADAFGKIKSLSIKGYQPSVVLCEELLEIDREFYLSMMVNRDKSTVELVAHSSGGVEVESNESEEFYRREMSLGSIDGVSQSLADYYDIPEKAFLLADIIERLYRCFVGSDALLVEINPLVMTKSGELVAGDCKMELDDMAAFRHPDWNFEDEAQNTNFVVLHKRGHVATIANGAGLAMATVDAVESAGMLPANFLDIGGGATTESTVAAFRKIMDCEDVRAIVINIFAGITRCDQVARAVVEAREHIPNLPPLFVRLAGTNYEQAVTILDAANIPLQDSLENCLALAKEVVHG